MTHLTPQQIVLELDKHIVGQGKAKRAVAVALRNRWRRAQVAEPLRQEITPKNILMIGPTGVGKTEIARRLARLADAPFIKVEATKFTEVGYVGRDVETIIRDLAEIAIKDGREAAMKGVRARAEDAAEEDDGLTVYTDMKDLAKVRTAIVDAGLAVDDAELQYVPNTHIEIADEETARKIMKILDALDEVDDVVNVHTNADITIEPNE